MAAGIIIVPYSTPSLLATGAISAASTMAIYNTGTLVLANVYADSGLVTPITNPLTANAAGRFTVQSTLIWASDAQAYDVVLTFSDGSNLTFDNIFVLEAMGSLSGYAPLNSPAFTGVPTAPTSATNDNSNKIATTAYVQNQNYAPLASPTFTGVPAAPTAAPGTNTTQLATTAFVQAAASAAISSGSGVGGYWRQFVDGIDEWGFTGTIAATSTLTVTFPKAFPTSCDSVVATSNTIGTNAGPSITAVTTTTFTIRNNQSVSVQCYWRASGH